MRRITENVFAELYFWSCNPGFLTTADGVFLIDTLQQPIGAVRWRDACLSTAAFGNRSIRSRIPTIFAATPTFLVSR